MMKARAQRSPWSGDVEVLLMTDTHVVTNLTLSPRPELTRVEPSFRLELTNAQLLMDELWQCGIRPSEGTGSAGAMAATEKHLADMRKLVFETLPVVARERKEQP
jgi:hypothetical protein